MTMRRTIRRVILASIVIAVSVRPTPATEPRAGKLPTLKVVGRFTLPERADRRLVDLRWAGKDSVYLADLTGGVAEARLADGLPEIRRVAPPALRVGLPVIRNMAISDKWIVVAHLAKIAWKPVAGGSWRLREKRGYIHELDIRGDDLVILGFPDIETYERAPGGIVWQSDLSKGLDHWDVLYESKEVAHDLDVVRLEAALGSLRFLQGGGFVVAPNFVPGVLRFSSSGAVKERWSPEELGASVKEWQGDSKTEAERVPLKDLRRFLTAQSTIEDVLALREGPAIVVREPRGNQVRYRLGVLGAEIQWYEIPVGEVNAMAWLRGDADTRGRIVLAAVERAPTAPGSGDIIVLQLP